MKKVLIPLSIGAFVLLIGAGCYAKKAANTNTDDGSTINDDSTFDTLNIDEDTNGPLDETTNEDVNANTNTATSNANANVNGNTNTASTAPSAVSVNIANSTFSPMVVSVAQNGTVTFTNNDSIAHTVKVSGQADHSIAAGGTYALAASTLTVGAHSYTCSIHPSMTGTITVVQ